MPAKRQVLHLNCSCSVIKVEVRNQKQGKNSIHVHITDTRLYGCTPMPRGVFTQLVPVLRTSELPNKKLKQIWMVTDFRPCCICPSHSCSRGQHTRNVTCQVAASVSPGSQPTKLPPMSLTVGFCRTVWLVCTMSCAGTESNSSLSLQLCSSASSLRHYTWLVSYNITPRRPLSLPRSAAPPRPRCLVWQ